MTPEEWQRVRPILESALELDSSSRAAFLDGACASSPLRREVESLIASHEQAGTHALEPGSPFASSHEDAAQFRLSPGKRIGPYEILEKIAVGGMGAVYRAIRADGQYKQQVALKIVRSELGAEFTATRFRNERQILASLDHPNIAKILDGGTTTDGLPYFVMEFINGLPITDYCDQHKLTIDQRLKIFRTVCSAVHYAHQHLVIHRDIKPRNILVASDGAPKLLDFGIAKILDPTLLPESAAVTLAGSWVMTPEYASPEQLRGEAISTATDVYLLGLVLYELLTGHCAYRFLTRMPHDVARVVLETEPEKLSTVIGRTLAGTEGERDTVAVTPGLLSSLRGDSPEKLRRRLVGDLDNIVLKAIRKEPGARYTSVEQLSEDIQRHLDGLPVLARKRTLDYRCRKFVLRHKVGVTAAALVLISLLTGLTLTVREARIARANELRSEKRFNDVRQLANSLMFEIHDSIQDLPGSTAARKLLVERALRYLDSLNQEASGNASLQRELATAYKRIADVQGYPFRPNLGDTPGAVKSYQRCLTIRLALAEANPMSPDDAIRLAECYRLLADTLLVSNDSAGALQNSRRAIQAAEQAERISPNDFDVLSELSDDYEGEADILSGTFNSANLGDSSTALPLRQKVLEIGERLARLKPDDPSIRRRVAVMNIHMGDQLLVDGQWRETLPYYSQAQKTFEELLAADSEKRNRLEDLHGVYTRLQQSKLIAGDAAGALAINRKALEISKKLTLADPRDAQARLALAQDYGNLADSLSKSGNNHEAIQACSEGLAILTQLVTLDPQNTEFRGMQAAVYTSAGDAYARSGNGSRALQDYREALSILSRVLSADTANVDGRLRLAGVSNKVASMSTRLRNFVTASVMFQKALELAQPQAAASHPSEQALYSTADSYAGLGETEIVLASDTTQALQDQIAHWDQARSWFQCSMTTWGKIKEPGLVSPDGFDCIPPSIVARQLARCKEALTRLARKRKRFGPASLQHPQRETQLPSL